MAASLFFRKCLSFGVSRVGQTTYEPPAGPSTTTDLEEAGNDAFTIVVIALSVSILVGVCIFGLILRHLRHFRCRRSETSAELSPSPVEAETDIRQQSKNEGQNDEALEEAKRSSDYVELVVMAGENKPTFLAHPVPAPSITAIVQCPPLNL